MYSSIFFLVHKDTDVGINNIRGAHRPKKTASGGQFQPDDVDDNESEEDDEWEDVDLDMD